MMAGKATFTNCVSFSVFHCAPVPAREPEEGSEKVCVVCAVVAAWGGWLHGHLCYSGSQQRTRIEQVEAEAQCQRPSRGVGAE